MPMATAVATAVVTAVTTAVATAVTTAVVMVSMARARTAVASARRGRGEDRAHSGESVQSNETRKAAGYALQNPWPPMAM